MPPQIRACRADEFDTILAVVNEAGQAYRGQIPDDCWHEPYMTADALRREIDAGVQFSALEIDGDLAGVMGAQAVRNVDLIRHAYVLPGFQGRGVGSRLMDHVRATRPGQVLVGAWAAAHWAVRFYERQGFVLTAPEAKTALLRTYWTVSPRQIETSVVLASPPLDEAAAQRLIAGAK
jgi:GNAT superfamily N-acetyltransferase